MEYKEGNKIKYKKWFGEVISTYYNNCLHEEEYTIKFKRGNQELMKSVNNNEIELIEQISIFDM